MICKKCGAEILEGSVFCTECGTPVEQVKEAAEQAAETVTAEAAAEVAEAVPAQNDTPILVLGIVSLAVTLVSCGSLGLVGMILGIVAMVKAKKFAEAGGVLEGKAKVGKILGIVGLVIGILATVGFIVGFAGTLIPVIIGMVTGGLSSFNY
ncbi:MAG: zinc ribbon domain-containing protein [Clostridia bacterium]|nr:zinc ribbon domain-containing protein [Clostridia bacterium]